MVSWKQKSVLFLVVFGITLDADFDNNNSLIEFYGLSDEKINIVIKDNIDIQGEVTSAGSIALQDNIASENAFIIQKLLDANYNIAGKANLSEWANFRSEESVSGWSSLGGQTTHFLFNNFNPCGSSSGSAVAVASGIVDIAIGTETNGSISCPSSINGIVGMKPTVGLVSRSGIIPISKTQDTAGPMGKSVKLVAKTLEVISGYDPDDPATSRIPDNFIFDFSSDLDNASLEGKRFGLLDSNNSNDQVKELHSVLIAFIESRGGSVIRFDDFRRYPGDDEYFLLKYEFKHGLERYLADSNSQMKTLKEIIEFNEVNKEKTMPFFDQGIFYSSLKLSEEHERYKKALQALMETKNQSLNILNEYKKDQVIDTEIKNITEFGIFAKLNENIDGLIHKNDLSWTDSNGDRTLKKYQKGQSIQVKILEIDPAKEKISFGIKQLTPDPFHEFFKDKNKGDIVSATITKISNNGIDVEVANFIETTIRRKELSKNKEEQNISRYNEGQKIDAKISSVDLTNRKFALSIRQLEIDEEQSLLEKYGSKSSGSVLGDILGKALDEDKDTKAE